MKGTYLLLVHLDESKYIKIGKLGEIFFKKGNYIYVGSALNGLEQRINRHKRNEKKLHWHIDYLLKYGKIMRVYYKQGETRKECNIAKILSKKLTPVIGFGSSDCNCNSHLFYDANHHFSDLVNNLDVNIFN